MEPLDPIRNIEGSGTSRRRISSILKAPRKSARFSDTEQQENVVECPKPVEKRNSRRVSFAPANDVLLFSKDIKNISPAQNPLQELKTATTTAQNRVQIMVAEDGSQIMGMETLLSAPLHASQPRDKVFFDVANDFGEKTVMFSTDDAFMDMTHSHTMNIASDAELLGDIPLHNYDIIPTPGEKKGLFTMEDVSKDLTLSHAAGRNMDLSVEKGITSTSNPGFDDFLATLFKPSGPSTNTAITRTTPAAGSAQIKTQNADVDKENRAPASVPALMEKSLNSTRKVGGPFYENTMCPEDDVRMDMTEAQTGRILGVNDDDDPFQCLFPTQEMYAHSDKRLPQTTEMKAKQQTGSKTPRSGDLKESAKKSDIISGTQSKEVLGSSKSKGMEISKVQRHQDKLDTEDDRMEKTVRFSADDACMDVTRSHTVNLATNLKLQSHQNLDFFPSCGEKTVRFSADDACMDVTRSHTVNIANNLKLQSQQNLDIVPSYGEKTVRFNANDAAMDMTQCITVNIASALAPDSAVPKASEPSVNPAITRATLPSAPGLYGDAVYPEEDVSMDMTEAQTGRIVNMPATDDPLQCLFPSQDTFSQSGNLKKEEVTSYHLSSETKGLPNCGGLETSLKTSLKTMMQRQQDKRDTKDDHMEKTVTFSADDACMDVTRSHTVNLATNLKLQSHQNLDFFPSCGEKTVRFSADDACMDVTRSHTVNIANNLKLQSQQNLDIVPSYGEKTVRFNANDAAMDMTQCITVNIASALAPDSAVPKASEPSVNPAITSATPPSAPGLYGDAVYPEEDVSMDMTEAQTGRIVNMPATGDPLQCLFPSQDTISQSGNLKKEEVTSHHLSSDVETSDYRGVESLLKTKMQSHQVRSDDDCRERTVRFTADDACLNVTQSHAVQTVSHSEQPHKTVDFLPASIEKTANDAARNVTQNHTVSITTALQQKSQHSVDFMPASGEKTMRFPASDAAMDMIQSYTANITIPDSDLPHQIVLPSHENMEFPKKRDSEICGLRRSRSLSARGLFSNLLSKTSGTSANPKTDSADTPFSQETADQIKPEKEAPALEKSVSNTMTDSDDLNTCMEMTDAQTDYIYGQMHTDEPPLCDSRAQDPHLKKMGVTSAQRREETSFNPDAVEITSSLYSNETETRGELSSPSAVDQDADRIYSRKSRRMTLADLQTKIRRLSHMINTAPDATAMDSCTAPLPQIDHNLNSHDKITSAPEVEPEPEISEDTQAAPPSATTPFNMKTNQLMSRLSMGGFKPKLPQRRSKLDDSKKPTSADHTKTLPADFTSQLNNFDTDERGICDEELDSYEDVSETLDRIIVPKISDKESPSMESNTAEVLADDVFEEDFINTVHEQKRDVEDMKRMNTMQYNEYTDTVEGALQSDVRQYDGNITVARTASQTIDSSSSIHTASIRCEATFESSFRPSLLESQLEDYASDVQKKLEEGTITVLEFFKLFNIDFVIHNPRQSVLPGRVLSDTDVTPMDLLKNKHISHPKQMVYEADVQTLTEKAEGLKVRMRDLDKPLKSVNKTLWEEMRYSSEKELKSFGSKLKERNNFFRKMGKVQSHEMKEVLYSNLVQVNLEEQQKLKGTIKEADEMLNSLDDCIHELEAELAAVEEKGFEDKPSLKSLQEEMKRVTESEAERDRQTAELEMQMKQNSSELKRLKAETRNLENHLDILNTLNEWKLRERKDSCSVFTFLNETMYLQLLYEKSNERGLDDVSERKIANIAFKFELDVEKSWCHAHLVHKLLSQYVEGEPAWVQKYPTSRYVPKLLHDVSLVVSCCRQMGEEIRLLKMWGGLRLDILDISCVDTRLRIVFSSLEKCSKFEVTFGVHLTNHLCVFQLEAFKNMIGNTTIQQIEEIVASFTPGKKLLTKIVRKIHDALLS